MKKYLTYELKRNLLPLAAFTAIACLVCAIFGATSYIISSYSGTVRAISSVISAPTVLLCILCTIVPVMQFSYRMRGRDIDLWYSLPVTREKLTLVRTLGGLMLVFVPYTLSYWLGFVIVLIRENYFVLYGYPLCYLASLPLGALLFGSALLQPRRKVGQTLSLQFGQRIKFCRAAARGHALQVCA